LTSTPTRSPRASCERSGGITEPPRVFCRVQENSSPFARVTSRARRRRTRSGRLRNPLMCVTGYASRRCSIGSLLNKFFLDTKERPVLRLSWVRRRRVRTSASGYGWWGGRGGDGTDGEVRRVARLRR
jgi:hypothetical protein